jgi:hypothetical protein
MALRFGTSEQLECIVDVPLQGPSGEALCLAHKLSTKWFLAGVYVTDDGYVLQVKGKQAYLNMPAGEELAQLQREGALPAVLPAYRISTLDYAFGYSLWIVLAGILVWTWVAHLARKRRDAVDAATPIDGSGPRVVTPTDRFIADQLAAIRRDGEVVSHQALVLDREATQRGVQPFFAALTDRRLVLIQGKLGIWGHKRENHGVESIERAAIRAVSVDGDCLQLHLVDGTQRPLVVPRRERGLSNQAAFARDLPKIFAGPAEEPVYALTSSSR